MQNKPKVRICNKCGRGIPTWANYCPHCKDIDEKNKIDPKWAKFAEFMQKQFWVKFVDSKTISKPKKKRKIKKKK